jgi:hypothetical protein
MDYLVAIGKIPDTVFVYRRVLFGFLCIIFVLNLFWFSLMIKGIWKIYVNKQPFEGDSRDDDHLKHDTGKKNDHESVEQQQSVVEKESTVKSANDKNSQRRKKSRHD